MVGEVRGTGVFWAVALVGDRATREPLVPYNASGPAKPADARPGRGVQAARSPPVVAMNRLHVVPPCTISAEEASLGLGVLDEALAEVHG